MGPMGPQRAPEWNQNGSFGTKMEPKWKFWNQNGTKIGFWEPKFDFWNQNGTKIGFLEPKWNQHLDFWNQNGTKILKYTEFLSKKRSHEFTPNRPLFSRSCPDNSFRIYTSVTCPHGHPPAGPQGPLGPLGLGPLGPLGPMGPLGAPWGS